MLKACSRMSARTVNTWPSFAPNFIVHQSYFYALMLSPTIVYPGPD